MMARSLQEELDAPPAPDNRHSAAQTSDSSGSASTQARSGRLPGEILAGPAHKAVQHLGRGTCKKLEGHFKCKEAMSLRELLRLFGGPKREELLMLIDAGQRQRVEAELVALSLDFPVE